VFTELLPSTEKRDTLTHRLMGAFLKYADEMGSSVIIYIPRFIRTAFRHSEVDRRYTQIQHGDHISPL
jgi:hypothetical protein